MGHMFRHLFIAAAEYSSTSRSSRAPSLPKQIPCLRAMYTDTAGVRLNEASGLLPPASQPLPDTASFPGVYVQLPPRGGAQARCSSSTSHLRRREKTEGRRAAEKETRVWGQKDDSVPCLCRLPDTVKYQYTC